MSNPKSKKNSTVKDTPKEKKTKKIPSVKEKTVAETKKETKKAKLTVKSVKSLKDKKKTKEKDLKIKNVVSIKAKKTETKKTNIKTKETTETIVVEKKKRGRKKKEQIEKINTKPLKKSDKDDPNLTLEEDLELGGLEFDDLSDDEPKIKRKRGRPPKHPVNLATVEEGSSALLSNFKKPLNLIKKVSKPNKKISDKLPGTGIADWIISNKISENLEDKITAIAQRNVLGEEETGENKTEEKEEFFSQQPSWTLPSWVTNGAGEVLVFEEGKLVKKNIRVTSENAPTGVSSPEEVHDIIMRIKETFKKKLPTSKKANLLD